MRLPRALHEPCRRLAAAAGASLLGIDFALGTDGGWQFLRGSVMPDLVSGGEPLVAALAEVLA